MYYHPLALKGVDIDNKRVGSPERADQVSRLVIEPAKRPRAAAHRILVPLDGSKWANEAIDCLIRSVSEMPPFEVHLLNVQPRIAQREFALENAVVGIERRTRLASVREALDRARALLDASGIPCKTAIFFGHPAQAIAGYAREHGIDAIVMGTRGMSPLNGLLRGSVATKVVSLADVPVTLIKSDEPVSL